MSLSSVFDPVEYPFWAINYFLALWFMAHLSYWSFSMCNKTFDNLSEEKRRNAVSYVMELIVTPFALFAELYGGRNVLFLPQSELSSTFESEIKWMTGALIMITVLYVWELIYRLRFGIPLLIHHMLTLLMMQLVAVTFEQEHAIFYIRFALSLGLYATTEQLSFVALLFFRLNIGSLKLQNILFLLSAIQTFVFKGAITVGACVYYFKIINDSPDVTDETFFFKHTPWGTFWKIALIPLVVGLFCSQLYACKILYELSQRGVVPKKRASSSVSWKRNTGFDAESLTHYGRDDWDHSKNKQGSKDQFRTGMSTTVTVED